MLSSSSSSPSSYAAAAVVAAALARLPATAESGHFLLFFIGGPVTESCDESSSVDSSVGLGVLSPSFVATLSFVSSPAWLDSSPSPVTGGVVGVVVVELTVDTIGVAGLSSESSVNEVVVLFSSMVAAGSADDDLPFVVVVVTVGVAVVTEAADSWLLSSDGSPLLGPWELPFSVLAGMLVALASGMPSRRSGFISEAI